MSHSNKVVWSEGLFLQPQHFQQQERYFEKLITNRPTLSGLTPYGFLEYEYDLDLLALGKFGLTRCLGVLPDGTVFNAPTLGKLPDPIDIPLNTAECDIYLALPLQQVGSPEIGSANDNPKLYRYQAKTLEVKDNLVGFDQYASLQVAELNLQLKLATEECGGYSYLAIARLKEVLPNQQLKLDGSFLPACLDIHAVTKLSSFAKELLSLLNHRGEILAQNQTETKYGNSAEIMDFALLNIINRAEAILPFLIAKTPVHPEAFYLYLIELLASLTTFNARNRHVGTLPSYKHQDLKNTFEPLMNALRATLAHIIQHNAMMLNLEYKQYGLWVAPIEKTYVIHKTQWILAVRADLEPEALSQKILSKVKIAAVEKIEDLIIHVLPGISLSQILTIPREIPFSSGYLYFVLNKSHPLWQDLLSSSGIAIHLGDELPEFKLQLWVIKEAQD